MQKVVEDTEEHKSEDYLLTYRWGYIFVEVFVHIYVYEEFS